MGKPYSQDLRERVIATVDSGTRVCVAARLFLVSVSYVSKVVGRRRASGETTARLGRDEPAGRYRGLRRWWRRNLRFCVNLLLSNLRLDQKSSRIVCGNRDHLATAVSGGVPENVVRTVTENSRTF